MTARNEDLFDMKMKERFKNETGNIPEAINEKFDSISTSIRNTKQVKNTPKFHRRKRAGIVAACILCALAITMQTTFAQQMVEKIIKSLSLSNITIIENEPWEWKDRDIPEAAKGKVFDKAGKAVEKITKENQDNLYDATGERVLGVEPDGTLLTNEVLKQRLGPDNLVVKDADKLNGYTRFDIKLPAYLPEGFEFASAEFFRDDAGNVLDDACALNFLNSKTGEELYIHATYISEGSSSETAFENIEKAKVNDKDAIIGDEGIVWEANGVSYLMYTYDLGRAEAIRIAESVK